MPQPQPTAHLALGVCDYPEHVSPSRWALHARQQRDLGLRYVRIAEFAWSRLEPRPGQFNWAWLDEIIDLIARKDLQVILCTPTAAPPAWLIRDHPDVLPVGRDGHVKTFGSRRHYDFSSGTFREHSRRITRAIAERYGSHPAVAGWQTDNEFGWGDTAQSFSPAAHEGFHAWLRERYRGRVDDLNDAWGNVFWSMEYTDFHEVPLPNHAVAEVNPSHALDFLRFSSDQVAAFHAEQIAILRECSPGRFVTHNYMGFFSAYDHYRVSAGLDFASWDSYPTGTLDAAREWQLLPPADRLAYARTGHPDLTAFNHDLYRGAVPHSGRFWVMEHQCGPVNWTASNPLPESGAVRLWTEQAWAHGADACVYFRWQAATMAQEVLHSGLLRHDGRPDRGFHEVAALRPQAYPLGPVRTRVALLHDYESLWLINAQPHADGMNYWAQTLAYYRALRSLGVDVDVIHADQDLGRYALVVAPAITLVGAERAARWIRAAAQGTELVFGARTAFRTPGGRTHEDGQFGPLSDLLGARLGLYDSLPHGLTQALSGGHHARLWAESYEPRGAQVLHTYQGGPLDGQAAVIRSGTTTVIGAHSDTLITELLEERLHALGLHPTRLPDGLRVTRRAGHLLVQNWTQAPLTWQGHTVPACGSLHLTPTPTGGSR
ncbi:beta-galactosidase [Deinococcus sp. PEB2-63]